MMLFSSNSVKTNWSDLEKIMILVSAIKERKSLTDFTLARLRVADFLYFSAILRLKFDSGVFIKLTDHKVISLVLN